MRAILWGLAMASLSSAALAGPPHRFQLFAATPRSGEFGFVDMASFDRTPTGVTYWSLSVYEPPAQISNGPPVIYQMRQRTADCARRSTKDDIVVARLKNGDERWISLVGHFRPVRPGSVGESELMLVCSDERPDARLPAFATIEEAVRFSDEVAARQPRQPATGPHAMPDRPPQSLAMARAPGGAPPSRRSAEDRRLEDVPSADGARQQAAATNFASESQGLSRGSRVAQASVAAEHLDSLQFCNISRRQG